MARLFEENDTDDDDAIVDDDGVHQAEAVWRESDSLNAFEHSAVANSGAPVPLSSAGATGAALSVVCGAHCTAVGVLETASRFLLHLSSAYYDAAVRKPAQNMALLARAQEEELGKALAEAAVCDGRYIGPVGLSSGLSMRCFRYLMHESMSWIM